MSWTEWTDTNFRNLNLNNLKVDEAYLNVNNADGKKYWLYWLTEECVKCPFKKLHEIHPNVATLIKLDVERNFELRLFEKDMGQYVNPNVTNGSLRWNGRPDVGQFGVYDLTIAKSGAIKWNTAKEHVNIYTSLILVLLIIIAFYWICKAIGRYFFSQETSTPETSTQAQEKTKKRLKSVDIFRGVAIVLMIFVNSGGGHYYWIEHATWNGLHFADLVFPWFLFVMGICIPMSIKSQINRQIPKREIISKIVKRSITLFLIGLFLNTLGGATFEDIRIPGVLQRFGIAYLFVSVLQVLLNTEVMNSETRIQQLFVDVRVLGKQWIVMICVIVVYLITMFGVKISSCERGYAGPGGLHDYMQQENCTGGITGLIDRVILGDHLYQWARIRHVYDSMAFDPEGIFGCLTTFLQVFLGVQCGTILLVYATPKDRLRRWIGWSVGLMVLTLILTCFSTENGFIPINKNLWSLSFVTVTASLAFATISLIYYLADVRGIGDDFWTIFLYPGMNAIVLYVGHSVFHKMWPFHFAFNNMNTHFILLLENVYTVTVWILISHVLYHKKMFYSV